MSSNPLKIMDTILRDAHQSLLATRMCTGDMLPIADRLEAVGFEAVEMWGGATFDTAMRFLKEDPWERITALRKRMPKTKFQMLLRGQNVVGYKHYPDDIVEKFVELSVKNGIDIFRIFDALNDIRNIMESAIKYVKKYGGHVQAAFSYTISPVHSIDRFIALSQELKTLGADSICIKDMAALCTPYVAFELVSRLKNEVGLPVQFHTHNTSGFAMATLILKAAEAGVDIVDTAISSIADGPAQPPTESVVAMMEGTERDTGYDLALLADISDYFKQVRTKHLSKFEMGLQITDVRVLLYQENPGGMLSNLVSQLRQQGAEHRYAEVLQEVPRVREDMGFPPLVTPTSQIVGTQAVVNVLTGQRYKIISQEVKEYCRGMYGRPPAPLNPELVKLAIGDDEPIVGRPADLLEPGLEKALQEIGDLAQSEEDVMSYAMYPQQAKEFLTLRKQGLTRPIEMPRIPADKPATEAPKAAAPAPAAPAAPVAPPMPAAPAASQQAQAASAWKMSGRTDK